MLIFDLKMLNIAQIAVKITVTEDLLECVWM